MRELVAAEHEELATLLRRCHGCPRRLELPAAARVSRLAMLVLCWWGEAPGRRAFAALERSARRWRTRSGEALRAWHASPTRPGSPGCTTTGRPSTSPGSTTTARSPHSGRSRPRSRRACRTSRSCTSAGRSGARRGSGGVRASLGALRAQRQRALGAARPSRRATSPGRARCGGRCSRARAAAPYVNFLGEEGADRVRAAYGEASTRGWRSSSPLRPRRTCSGSTRTSRRRQAGAGPAGRNSTVGRSDSGEGGARRSARNQPRPRSATSSGISGTL